MFGTRALKPDDILFSLPTTTDLKDTYIECIKKLAHDIKVFELTDPSAVTADDILSNLYGEKCIPISVLVQPRPRPTKASSAFKSVDVNESIRDLCVESVDQVDTSYRDYVRGAYVSTIPTTENLYELQRKVCSGKLIYDVNEDVLLGAIGTIVDDLDISEWQMDVTVDPSVVDCIGSNPNAGVGFKHYNVGQTTKREDAPIAARCVKDYLELLEHVIGSSENYLPPFIHTYAAKAEVRDKDTPPGKIRIISMLGMIPDMITAIVGTPFMQGLQRWKGCLIGTSIWSSLVYYVLYGLDHADFNRYANDLKQGQSTTPMPRNAKRRYRKLCRWLYITFDISTQDWSYTPCLLSILRIISAMYCKSQDANVFASFKEMFAIEAAYVDAKLVKWFSDVFYIILGIMASGYGLTSHFATMMTFVSIRIAALTLLLRDPAIKPKIREYLKMIMQIFYGDDGVLRIPLKLAKYFCSDPDGTYPDLLAAELKRMGVILKPGETKIFRSTDSHQDPMYTHIEDDEIVSEGVHILQRYFVKYDAEYNPLHPDTEDFDYVLPWRKTAAYATKMGTDANNWKGKFGREKPVGDSWVQFYLKLFGLLCDAGPNWKAHRMIRTAMDKANIKYPGLAEAASSSDKTYELQETLIRLACNFEVATSLMSYIHELNHKVSYWSIVSLIRIGTSTPDIKFPLFTTTDEKQFFEDKSSGHIYNYCTRSGKVCRQ